MTNLYTDIRKMLKAGTLVFQCSLSTLGGMLINGKNVDWFLNNFESI